MQPNGCWTMTMFEPSPARWGASHHFAKQDGESSRALALCTQPKRQKGKPHEIYPQIYNVVHSHINETAFVFVSYFLIDRSWSTLLADEQRILQTAWLVTSCAGVPTSICHIYGRQLWTRVDAHRPRASCSTYVRSLV